MMEMLCAGEDVLRLSAGRFHTSLITESRCGCCAVCICLMFVFGGCFVGFVLWVVAVCFVCFQFGCFGLFMTFSK